MIFPTPVDPLDFDRYPMTWMLVCLNIFLFVLIFMKSADLDKNDDFLKESSLQRTGHIYFQFHSPYRNIAEGKSDTEWMSLGMQALRDARFMMSLEKLPSVGDHVQFQNWQKKAIAFRDDYFRQPTFQYGLRPGNDSSWTWLTYQFSHASWLHLLSNCVYLIILGSAVEGMMGGVSLLVLYICGGWLGGLFFIWGQSHGLLPVIGASGSISALMGFYALAEWKKKIKYFYFLSPIRDHFGFIYLPAALIIPLYLISDWVNWLAYPSESSSSTAYTAHLGGSVLGLIAAGFYLMAKRKIKTQS